MVSRKRITKLKQACEGKSFCGVTPSTTHCYCNARGLEYPHYMAEHTQEHDDERELRARRAEGTE